jgi:ATP-binding cassette subfamily C protein
VIVGGRTLADTDVRRWRQSIGYVPQDTFLLHDTVRANLLWARPGATESEMWAALDQAAAGDFLRRDFAHSTRAAPVGRGLAFGTTIAGHCYESKPSF